MRLFKRKKPEVSLCPRCSQLVTDADGNVCPMCGWDLRDAYQGPSYQPPVSDPQDPTPARTAATDGHDDETDPRIG
jgi:hypothetical protein